MEWEEEALTVDYIRHAEVSEKDFKDQPSLYAAYLHREVIHEANDPAVTEIYRKFRSRMRKVPHVPMEYAFSQPGNQIHIILKSDNFLVGADGKLILFDPY